MKIYWRDLANKVGDVGPFDPGRVVSANSSFHAQQNKVSNRKEKMLANRTYKVYDHKYVYSEQNVKSARL